MPPTWSRKSCLPRTKRRRQLTRQVCILHAVLSQGIFHVGPKVLVVLTFAWYLALFVQHSTYVTSTAYSSPSVVLASRLADGSQYIIDDYREAYYWLRMNTPDDARVMSWWDYGYQIAGMADRTTLVDNNTWNNTHIAVLS